MSKALVFFLSESSPTIRVTNDITYRRYTTIENIILLRIKLWFSKMNVIRHTEYLFICFSSSDYNSVRLGFVQTRLLI